MKITDMLKVVDKNWVRKPEGFRVRFQRLEETHWVTDYMPDLSAKPLDSAVVAWRAAWKLQQASRTGHEEYVNLAVVDDLDNPIRYYATGNFEVFNKRERLATSSFPEVSGKARVAGMKSDLEEGVDEANTAWEGPDSDEDKM